MQVKKNDMPIKDVLKNFVSQQKITPGYYNAKIQQIWVEKMGNSVNQHTLGVRLVQNHLYIKLDSAALKNEFSMSKEKLISILNKEIGSEIISKISIN